MERRQMGTSVHFEDGHGEEIDRAQVHKCTNCGLTACKGEINAGTKIELKCRRCGKLFVLQGL